MRSNLLPASIFASTFFHKPFILLAGVLVWLSPLALSAQSVTFAGALSTLPTSGLDGPYGIAVDSAGDVFIGDYINKRVVELPRTATGYGPQTTLPFSDSPTALGVAVDNAGDVFIANVVDVEELPKTATGYGPQTILWTPPTGNYSSTGIAVDNAGDVFICGFLPYDGANTGAVELPLTEAGYGPQITLPTSGLFSPAGIAVDSAGDVFIADAGTGRADTGYGRVVELPKTSTGYGPQTTLPTSGLSEPVGVAVDSAGDVFISDGNEGSNRVVELPRTATAYGPQITLPGIEDSWEVAVDNAGDVFVAEPGYARAVEVQTRSVNFGSANFCAPGQTSPAPCSQTSTLSYDVTGSGTLGTPKALTGGAPNLDFTLASGSTCTGAVTEGAMCTVNVTFAPQAAGVRNGSVEIVDGGGNVLATTLIYGTGVPVGFAQLSASLLDFGTIPFGSTDTLQLTITNIGTASFTLASSINGQSYTIAGGTCGASLAPNNSCTLQVEFSPVVVGTHHDRLTFVINGAPNPSVSLHGVASGVSSATRVLNFATIPYHTTSVIPLTITNFDVPGTVTIGTAISGISFKVLTTAQNTCLAGISAGQSCTLPVEFSPTSQGNHNELLTLTPSGGAAASEVHLDGYEAAP